MKEYGKMGVGLKHREFDVDRPSHTEELSNWILRVRSKKITCRRSRRRNLRMEAVLGYALSKAERELRTKQTMRFNRWQQVKDRMKNSHKDYDGDVEHFSNSNSNYNYTYNYNGKDGNAWQAPLCSELSSFDSFMSMLKEIKVPLER